MSEILKGLISLIIAFTRTDVGYASMHDMAQAPFPAGGRGLVGRLRKLWRDVFSPDCWKLSIPAILYGASSPFRRAGHLAHTDVQSSRIICNTLPRPILKLQRFRSPTK
jgi:hypothetical protein